MLEIVGDFPWDQGRLEVDPLVPLSFRAYDRLLSPHYWFADDPARRSMLELKISGESRAVMGATLTAYYGRLSRGPFPPSYLSCPETVGLPTVSLEGFEKIAHHEIYDFRVLRSENSVVVAIEPNAEPDLCFRCSRLRLYSARSFLCSVGFFDLSDAELSVFMEWEKWSEAKQR